MKKSIGVNRAETIKSVIDRNPITIFIVILVFFISSFFSILQGISWTLDLYQRIFNWRQAEYAKINHIRTGMSQEKVDSIFGIPSYTRLSKTGFKENIYKERDYWIQSIATSSGEVVFYSVTSCDPLFKPKISPNPLKRNIVLQVSTFHSIGDDPTESKYYLREATANSYFYDEYSFGNPSDYKKVFVGLNDACELSDLNYPVNRRLNETLNLKDNDIAKFRSTAPINTYAETGIFYGKEVLEDFQIGVDRVQIRSSY